MARALFHILAELVTSFAGWCWYWKFEEVLEIALFVVDIFVVDIFVVVFVVSVVFVGFLVVVVVVAAAAAE